MEKVIRFLKDEEGIIAIEYGLIIALVAFMLILGATTLGENIHALFNNIASVMGLHTGVSTTPGA
ncbi:MAG: Flp family type IVb pilin [Syntrophales bacterium]|jgi:pilus assembly protein Flp/PilA|nr:Flp family type IVb pilin [Syntrophales bacterium]MDY0043618.1 Flp family type IVb pilin [Syntrophales bacterium]